MCSCGSRLDYSHELSRVHEEIVTHSGGDEVVEEYEMYTGTGCYSSV